MREGDQAKWLCAEAGSPYVHLPHSCAPHSQAAAGPSQKAPREMRVLTVISRIHHFKATCFDRSVLTYKMVFRIHRHKDCSKKTGESI